MLSLTNLSDAELIVRVREQDDAAYSVLWERHNAAAVSAARAITHRHDPEDMAQEAFARVLNALRNGSGPDQGFRSYLYTTLRTVSMAWSEKHQNTVDIDEHADHLSDGSDLSLDTANKSLTVTAFAALPEEWRTILWYSEVEQMTPAEIAPILGMTPGAVAALSFRARNGLRQSWLQAHAAAPSPDSSPDCKWAHENFAAYLRDNLSARRTDRIQNHLIACFPCSTAFAELSEVNQNLRGLLLPLVLGVPAAALARSGFLAAPATGVVTALPVAAPASWGNTSSFFSSTPGTVTKVGFGAVALGAAGVAIALLTQSPAAPEAQTPLPPSSAPAPSVSAPVASPVPAPTSAAPEETTAAPEPAPPASSDPSTPARPPQPSNSAVAEPPVAQTSPPPATTPPSPTPTPTPTLPTTPPPSPDPTPPTIPPVDPNYIAPVVDEVAHDPRVAPRLTGQGTPGAAITVLAGNKELASTTVGPDKSWQLTVPATALTPNTPYTFKVQQVTAGSASKTETTSVTKTDGSSSFEFVAPSWSHVASSDKVEAGSPDAITSGGTIEVNGDGSGTPNSRIFVYFSGEQGSRIRVAINGVASQNIHEGAGNMLLARSWSKPWTAQEAGPQVLEIFYELPGSTPDNPLRGPSAIFNLNVNVK